MTNQNPAAPNPQSTSLDPDTLTKVNAHADRSIDRLFADIDELLSGDLANDLHSSSSASTQQHQHSPAAIRSGDPQNRSSQPPVYLPPTDAEPQPQPQLPGSAPPQQQQRIPLWMKALLGIGITSIALGSLLLWLVNERKIELPKNIDTSWIPFQSKSQVSPEDAKFAEYLRKSISKIDAANTQSTTTTNLPNPTNPNILTHTTQATPVAFNPNRKIVAPIAGKTNAIQAPISLIKTVPTSRRPSAIFEINGQSQTVNIGQNIGTSRWSLLTVARGEVLLKKAGGEIRSIRIGQKF
jgi:hypothetical protein